MRNGGVQAGRKTAANTATTAVTIRNTPPSQARRRVRRSTGQPILSIPILPSGLMPASRDSRGARHEQVQVEIGQVSNGTRHRATI